MLFIVYTNSTLPTGALDYNTSKEILKLIENVNVKYGNTVIMVTHNEAIRHMADHVIKLRDGAVRHNDINEHKISAAEGAVLAHKLVMRLKTAQEWRLV
jgi:ABC-type methionine transport system ATPase subunit